MKRMHLGLAAIVAAGGCNDGGSTILPPGTGGQVMQTYPGINIYALWHAANATPCGVRSFETHQRRDTFYGAEDAGKGAKDFSFRVRPDTIPGGQTQISITSDYDTIVSLLKFPLSLTSPSEEAKMKLARELVAETHQGSGAQGVTLDLSLSGDEGAIVVVDGASAEAGGTATVMMPCTISTDAGVSDAATSTLSDAGTSTHTDAGMAEDLSGQYFARIAVDVDPGQNEPNVMLGAVEVIGIAINGGSMMVTGTPPMPDLSGTRDNVTGQFDISGAGQLASVANVPVRIVGTLDLMGNLAGTLTAGAGGELPGGMPITYRISASRR